MILCCVFFGFVFFFKKTNTTEPHQRSVFLLRLTATAAPPLPIFLPLSAPAVGAPTRPDEHLFCQFI